MTRKPNSSEQGFALVTVLMLVSLLVALLSAYYFTTRVQMSTTKSSMDGTTGYYAAEAGLNTRADQVRQTFVGYNRPAGTSPTVSPGVLPCEPPALGSGDFACQSFDFRGRDVRTYVEEPPGNPSTITIPPGVLYQNLTGQEYAYDVNSMALNNGNPEAILALGFRSVLVPLFQFAAFYNKDLEILPGPAMTLAGPVHSNGNLFLDAGASLIIEGQVTTAGNLYRGRKNDNSCSGSAVNVWDPSSTPVELPSCGNRTEVTQPEVSQAPPAGHHDWGGLIRTDVEPLVVPPPQSRDPVPGATYWDIADVRVMLDLDDAVNRIKIYNADGSENLVTTGTLTGCATPAVDWLSSSPPPGTDPFYNHREGTTIHLLEIDVEALLTCIDVSPSIMGGKLLDDATEGGLVWYFGVKGPNESTVNNYGVRLQNGRELASTASSTQIRGLTVVTNQALYVQGDYNAEPTNWKPAALMADSLNVLSNNWDDQYSAGPLSSRTASATAIYTAFLSGTDTTGGPAGEGGLSNGNYNGGLENYPRFHENWNSVSLTYRGSFVSLDQPQHVDGSWSAQSYSPPIRDWGFDSRFNNAASLPPASPRFVYLTQDLFVRDFEY